MKKLVLIFFTITTLFACKEEENVSGQNKVPTIHIINQSVPTESEYLCDALFDNVLKLTTGDTLKFLFEFQSENPLSQYKIDIHNNFDCHSHGKSLDWSVLKVVDLTGNHALIEEKLLVPEDASAGNYHFMIRLLDVYGNEAEVKEFNIIIENSDDQVPPQININSPIENAIYNHSDNVFFNGLISDNSSLEDGKFELKYTDANNQNYSLYEVFYTTGTTTSYTIDTSYTIGAFMALGEGFFTIKAYDKANNFSTKTIPITIQ